MCGIVRVISIPNELDLNMGPRGRIAERCPDSPSVHDPEVQISKVKDSLSDEDFIEEQWVHFSALVPNSGMDLSNGRIRCELKG